MLIKNVTSYLDRKKENQKKEINFTLEFRQNVLVIFLSLIVIIFSIFLSTNFSPFLLVLFGFVLFITYFSLRYFEFSLGVFLTACTLNLFEFPLGSYNIRPETVGLLLSSASLLLHSILKTKTVNIRKEFLIVMMYIAFSIFVSYFVFNQTWVWSKPGILQLSLSSLGTMFLVGQINTFKDVRRFCDVLAVVGLVHAVYGFIGYVSYNPNISWTTIPIMTGQLSTSITLRGMFFEANLFSVLMGFGLLLCITNMMQKENFNKLLYNPVTALIFSAAILLGWTRSVWLSLAICFIIIPILGLFQKKNIIQPRFLFKLLLMFCLLVPVALIIVQSFNQTGVDFSSKITGFADTDKGSNSFRKYNFDVAINNWMENPLIGNGYFSIKEMGPKAWIVMSPVAVLHDTGIIGMLIALSLLIPLIVRGFKLSVITTGANRPYIISIYCGAIMAIIGTCFTTAHTLSFFWLQLGLLASSINMADLRVNFDNYKK